MAIKRYKAAPGAPFPKKDAPVIGKRLEQIEEEQGRITPEAVVADSRRRGSPFQKLISWDDASAAQSWRLAQARNIINHVVVVFVSVGGVEKESKGFHSVRFASPDSQREERSYASMSTVDNDPELREQVIAEALRRLEYWKEEYGKYRELWGVVKAIGEATKRMASAARAGGKRGK